MASIENCDPYKVIEFLKNCDNNKYLLQEDKDYINSNRILINELEKLDKNNLNIIFSCEKKFNKFPILINKKLAMHDFHIFRIKIAEIITSYRRNKLNINVSNPYVSTLLKDGIVIINNFLDNDSFEKLKQEIDNNINKNLVFNNETHKILNNMKNNQLYNVANFINNKTLNDILYSILAIDPNHFYSSKRSRVLFQKLKQNTCGDIQTQIHTDTFQHTYRWWFYLSDVTENDGAFRYSKDSHINDENRINFEREMYSKVLKNIKKLDSESQGGSYRYQQYGNESDIKLDSIVVPKNTLIVVNTHGFHGRGVIQPGHERYSLFGYSRINPYFII